MKFKCEFDLDSSMFSDDGMFDVSIEYILRHKVLNKIVGKYPHKTTIHSQIIYDMNGNRIGTWKIAEEN